MIQIPAFGNTTNIKNRPAGPEISQFSIVDLYVESQIFWALFTFVLLKETTFSGQTLKLVPSQHEEGYFDTFRLKYLMA